MILAAIFPLFPLCQLRNMGPLKYTSIAGVWIVAGIFAYTFYLGAAHWDSEPIENDTKVNMMNNMFTLNYAIFSCVGHAAAAYGVHMNATRFYSELKIKTSENFKKVTFMAFVGSFVFKTPFAVVAYSLFGDSVEPNVLKNFKIWPGFCTMTLWIAMALSLTFTFPLMFSAARESLFSVLAQVGLGNVFPNKGPARIGVITALLAFLVSIAVVFGKLDMLSRIKGHILANCICLLFPPLIYLNLGNQEEEMPMERRGKVSKKQWIIKTSYAILGVSCFMIPLGIYNVFC
jgi:amino acid permease